MPVEERFSRGEQLTWNEIRDALHSFADEPLAS
jgi:hypothetical protein